MQLLPSKSLIRRRICVLSGRQANHQSTAGTRKVNTVEQTSWQSIDVVPSQDMNRNSGGSEPGFLQSLQNPFLQLDWGRRRPPLPPAEPQSGPVLESWRRLRQREAGESAGRRSPSPPQQIDVRPSDAGVRSPSIQEANGEDIEHLAVVSEPEDMEGMEFEVDSAAETGIEFLPNLHVVIEQQSRKRRVEVDDVWSNLENENLDDATEHQEIDIDDVSMDLSVGSLTYSVDEDEAELVDEEGSLLGLRFLHEGPQAAQGIAGVVPLPTQEDQVPIQALESPLVLKPAHRVPPTPYMEGMEFEVDSAAETGIEFLPNLHIIIEQQSRKRREEVNEMWSNYEKPRKKRRMEVDDMWSNLENENLDGATEHQEIEPVEFPGVDHGGDEIEAGPVATEQQMVEPEEFLGVDHGGDKIEATTEIRRSRRLAQRFEHAVRATASTTQAPTNLPGQQPIEHNEEIEEVVAANRAIPPRRASTRQRNPPARYGEWVDSGKLDFRKIR